MTITITQPVNAVDDVFPVQGGNAILEDPLVVPVKLDVLANDFLETNPNPLAKKGLSAVTKPVHGTTAINNNNTPNDPTDDFVDYTPDANFFGTDTFTYTATDDLSPANFDTATVTVTVTSVNDAPVADDDSAETAEDVTKSILVLDGDRPGPAGTVAPWDESAQTISVVSVSDPLHGTAVIQNGGAGVDYTPDKDFFGTDTFTYVISDGETTSNTATVTVTVTPVNDAPVAGDDPVPDALENTPKLISVLVNDNVGAANEAPPQTLTIDPDTLTQPSHGTVSLTNNNTQVLYTPSKDYVGPDSFQYSVIDSGGGNTNKSNLATVTLTVNNVNDPVDALDDPDFVVDEFTTNNSLDVLANDSPGRTTTERRCVSRR